MQLLDSILHAMPDYQALLHSAAANEPICLSGLAPIHRAQFCAALLRDTGRPLVAVCQDDMAAQRTQSELAAFVGYSPELLPTRELTLYDAAGVSRGWEQRRLRQFDALQRGKTRLLVTSYEALTMRTMPPAALCAASITISTGSSYSPEALAELLLRAGYSRSSLVEGIGQFALRGGILDVFSPAADHPVRIEFFGDEIDAMGWFDPATQRRTENADGVTLLPVAETLPGLHPDGVEGLCEDLRALIARQRRRRNPNEALLQTLETDLEKLENGVSFPAADRYMSLIYPTDACAVDYFPQDAIVVFCDYGAISRSARAQEDALGLSLDGMLESGLLAGELCDFSRNWDALCAGLQGRAVVLMENFLSASFPDSLQPKQLLSVAAKQLPSYGGSMDTAVSDLEHYQRSGFRTLVLCGNRRRAEILQQMLSDRSVEHVVLAFPATDLPEPGQILLTEGALPNGIEYPTLQVAVLTEGQLTAPTKRKAKPRKSATNRQKLNSFTDLSPGDLVVHEHHGIGRYVAMEQMKIDGVVKDYVKIAYQGTDVLYVPATQLDLISKYIGAAEDATVRLNKLSGDTWQKAKTRARAAVKDLAEGLIKLYAERKKRPGYAFAADSPWQKEFEDNFEFAETDDQLRCIAEIKADMESPTPMDRLLCGDVGFGKTEVALRAAMKCILDGKQVAILVPTTVLAQQHYVTSVRRFKGFPVNIDVLSRFRTPAQQRTTLRNLAAGNVDLIVGTHKLLQSSIQFKDLGLLIIDEEQRFGVTHKERLKEISRGVDVLTLSATPIPRTLNMALSGIRDMSTLEEPPGDRFPVQTFVMEHDDRILDDAIRREIARGGQVYYLHNRVETIEQCAWRMRQRIPDAEIAVIHGQMHEDQIGDVMQRMADGEIQILVCTTIIETGIDIPNANTLIIEDADRLGLAQLHQLRGRVGRSNRHAFAYLTFRKGKVLSEVAEKRLTAIREFAEFGSGFKIAMRDLEIRGAGNILGAEQSGHMLSVGYDMYLKLLEEAVLEEQGQSAAKPPECTADLSVTANIPKSYVGTGEQRMDLYRRIAAVRSQEDADDLLDEIVDRYGDPPRGVLNLIDIALLRANAAQVGIEDIVQKNGTILFTLRALDLAAVSGLCTDPTLKGRILFSAGNTPMITCRLTAKDDPLKMATLTVRLLGQYTNTTENLMEM
jgi:transcription-repair coupling factor (superfamily II helicase)